MEKNKKLTLSEAKELYRKAKSISNSELQDKYINEIVLGTMYLIDKYFNNGELELLQSSRYDTEDIKSSLTECWIKSIRAGNLDNVNSFSTIYRQIIENRLYKSLGEENTKPIIREYGLDLSSFSNLLYAYLNIKNEGKEINGENLYNIIRKAGIENEKTNHFIFVINQNHPEIGNKLFMLFEGIYNNLSLNKQDDLKLTPSNTKKMVSLLLNNSMFEELNDNILEDDPYEEILNKAFVEKIERFLTKREKEILDECYGLDNKGSKSQKDIAEDIERTQQLVSYTKRRALKKLSSRNF